MYEPIQFRGNVLMYPYCKCLKIRALNICYILFLSQYHCHEYIYNKTEHLVMVWERWSGASLRHFIEYSLLRESGGTLRVWGQG